MSSIKHTLLLWAIVINAILHTAADNSSCSANSNTACTILPFDISRTPDVWLNVPNLSVDKITLLVQNVKAAVSLSVNVSGLVSVNAGVDVSIDQVNLTISGERNF